MASKKPIRGTWDQLRMAPTTLTKLVIEGKAKIVGKDQFGRLIYDLKPR